MSELEVHLPNVALHLQLDARALPQTNSKLSVFTFNFSLVCENHLLTQLGMVDCSSEDKGWDILLNSVIVGSIEEVIGVKIEGERPVEEASKATMHWVMIKGLLLLGIVVSSGIGANRCKFLKL